MPMRIAIYSDFAYRRHGGRTYAEQAFAVFLGGLSQLVQESTLLGRLDPKNEPWHFVLPDSIVYAPLPHYRRASEPLGVLTAAGRSGVRFWRALGRADVAFLFGPNPLALAFGVMTM